MPKKTRTKTLEIPVTAMAVDKMPDGLLGSEWFKNYPVGTEVLVYETETVVPETSAEVPRLGRTAAPPQYDKHYYEGSRDYIKVGFQDDSAVIALRYHVFPAIAYPDITKRALKENNMAKRAKTAVLEIPPGEDREARQRRELLEAYRKRDAIQHDLYRIKSATAKMKSDLSGMAVESEVLESLLHGLLNIDGVGNSWDPAVVSNFIIAVLQRNSHRAGEIRKDLSGYGGQSNALAKKLTAVNNEIRLLFERGPNPQRKFDMDGEQVDGKTAAAGG